MNISAIVPAYNTEKYLRFALNSLINQSYPLAEIIIIDDCSQDDTLKIAKEFQSRFNGLKIIHQIENKGVSSARNIGIKRATGDWILFLDADDIVDKNLLKKQVDILLSQSKSNVDKWVAVYPSYEQIDKEGQSLGDLIKGKQVPAKESFGYFLLRNQIITPSGLLVKKDVVLDLGGFDESLALNEDWDLWLRMSKHYGFLYVEDAIAKVRRHENNTTNEIRNAVHGENSILNRFKLEEIRNAIFKRNLPYNLNKLEYTSMLYRLGHWVDGYNEIQNINDNDYVADLLFLKALYKIKKKEYVRAKHDLELVVAKNSSNGAALNNLGVLQAILGDVKSAKRNFEKALELFPGYLDASYNFELINKNQNKHNLEFKITWRTLRNSLLRYSK
ncbi:glycosyltransferase [Halalkalibacter sp. APA_J-10(15)]|uniref:glycosyltransferase n=1 Tax=Halalkalibacter sp. APA_J-10(15) TaxID=2933805 RepID=UPI001FF2A2B2|nr:glycosyltransferase [Halalkalibacter sp. APA_J-10(15)]MCK0472945.1 glycosyltransferase [Halalkalibacter sp. APA_J-10(15)]